MEHEDYFEAYCKIPKKDKDGNDIDGVIGTGGLRRKDGTLAALAYDIHPADNNPPAPQPVQPIQPVLIQNNVIVQENQKSALERFIEPYLPSIRDAGVRYFDRHIDDWVDKGLSGLWNGCKLVYYKVNGKIAEKRVAKRQALETKTATPASAASTALTAQNELFTHTYCEYKAHMTSDEARKKLLDAYVLAVVAVKNLNEVANAQIVDDSGNVKEGSELIRSLNSKEIIMTINKIMQQNPALLDDWQSKALSTAFGERYKVERHYILLSDPKRDKDRPTDRINPAQNGNPA